MVRASAGQARRALRRPQEGQSILQLRTGRRRRQHLRLLRPRRPRWRTREPPGEDLPASWGITAIARAAVAAADSCIDRGQADAWKHDGGCQGTDTARCWSAHLGAACQRSEAHAQNSPYCPNSVNLTKIGENDTRTPPVLPPWVSASAFSSGFRMALSPKGSLKYRYSVVD